MDRAFIGIERTTEEPVAFKGDALLEHFLTKRVQAIHREQKLFNLEALAIHFMMHTTDVSVAVVGSPGLWMINATSAINRLTMIYLLR